MKKYIEEPDEIPQKAQKEIARIASDLILKGWTVELGLSEFEDGKYLWYGIDISREISVSRIDPSSEFYNDELYGIMRLDIYNIAKGVGIESITCDIKGEWMKVELSLDFAELINSDLNK